MDTIEEFSEDPARKEIETKINNAFDSEPPENKRVFVEKLQWVIANIHTIHSALVIVNDLGSDTDRWYKLGGDVGCLGLINWVDEEIREK